MNDNLEFITASAGTGKTFRLVEIVHEAVCEGSARPEGIIATTFTTAVASELRDRLARRFHEKGRHSDALRLREGYIGTVHGICLELLTRFAFEAGLPPEMRVLDETETTALLTQSMNDIIDEGTSLDLLRLSDRLGQKDDRSNTYRWENLIRGIVGEARANNIAADQLPDMGRASWLEMRTLLPPETSDDLGALLRAAIEDALDNIPESPKTKTSQDYRRLLSGIRRSLPGKLTWAQWLKLSKEMPAKAEQEASEEVRLVASRHAEHPEFQRDLQVWLESLFGIASRVSDRFQSLKREHGAVDFQDLEKEMLDLLRGQASVREILAEEIDLLVVDEFQDTSPIQLAVFTELGRCARRVIWVGDVKQSIYQFRGADPGLVRDAVSRARKQAPLGTSWRSLPDLVGFANALFAAPFAERIALPEHETVITAHRQATDASGPSLEIAAMDSGFTQKNGKPKALTKEQKSGILADLVEAVLESAHPVTEKASVTLDNPQGHVRPLRAGDIAVLVRTHENATNLAESLRRRGIDAVLGGSGLLGTPECRLALACLRRLLDPADSLATAEIVALENLHRTEDWIEQRIRFLRDCEGSETEPEAWALEGDLISPGVVRLEQARGNGSLDLLSPLQRYDMACAAADITRIAAGWGPTPGHARQRSANLEQMRRLVSDYEEHCAEFGIPATIMGLFVVLDDLKTDKGDKKAVDPSLDAVQVRTYHGAKGLEWPVVIASDLDFPLKTRLYNLRAINTSPGDGSLPDDPLANRELRLWVNPYSGSKAPLQDTMESSETGKASFRDAEDEELRLLYVGVTRARDRLILPVEADRPHPWLEGIGRPAGNITASSEETSLMVRDATFPVRRSAFVPRDDVPPPAPVPVVPFPFRTPSRTVRSPAVLVPSARTPLPGAVVGEILEFGERLPWLGSPDERDLGDAMHRVLASEILNPGLPDEEREARTRGILAAFGLDPHVEPAHVLATVDRYGAFVRSQFAPVSERVEVPFNYRNEEGQQVTGYIDHVLETSGGLVIVDHKIYPGKRDSWEAKALSYSGQLALYREALAHESPPPVQTWIHFASAGAILPIIIPS